jgi:hypothetical protein
VIDFDAANTGSARECSVNKLLSQFLLRLGLGKKIGELFACDKYCYAFHMLANFSVVFVW